jgi:Holliday junction resolvasome RuvABC endonuclease subunit
MRLDSKKYSRILAIAPSSRGFGYAVLEAEKIANYGSMTVSKDKNPKCAMKAEGLILHFEPEVLALEDTGAEGSKRHPRIRELSQRLLALSLHHKIPVAWFSREQVMQFFLGYGKGTKQQMAQSIGNRFREDLGPMVPPKREAWMNQDYRIDIFDAVALALMFREAAENLKSVGNSPRIEKTSQVF